MLLPQTKEREYRFRLALRMVLPIFGLVLALILHTFITSRDALPYTFYIESTLVLSFSIYYIFYLIYKGFDKEITDNVSKVFTREFLYSYLKKELLENNQYTLLLVSIDNLHEINAKYGIKNGDKVLYEVAQWIGEYFQHKDIKNFPLGHIKGGDFVIGLSGPKSEYKTILELMCLKSSEFKIDDIEIQISGAINDKTFSQDLSYLIENLFELQSRNRNRSSKQVANFDNEMNPNELESLVINAIKRKDFLVMLQDIFENDKVVMKECSVKLQASNGVVLHQKVYMKVLDKLRLMVEYDLMVLSENIVKCNNDSKEKFAINISPTSIRNPHFITKVKELLDSHKNAKNKVVFILSEIEYYPIIDKYNQTLQSLRKMGVEIAIDRLGSIHTSFLYLRDLDIDIVRFDSYYTKEKHKNMFDNIINGFNRMAHVKGVKTWVKMVENEDINQIAKELNIDYLQGKYLSELQKIQ